MDDRNTGHVRTVVVCDDIRQEITSKFIFIGVYSGDFVLPAFPATVAPQIYIEYVPKAAGESDFSVGFLVGGKRLAEINGQLRVQEPRAVTPLIVPQVLLQVSEPSSFEVEFGAEGQPPEIILRKLFQLGEVISPTASPQPSSQSRPDVPAS